jgi:hypothetical protein
MAMRGIRSTVLVRALAVTSLTVTVSAQMFVPTGRDTLRGLPGVEVLVESLPPEMERVGLTTAGLRTEIEQRLKAGGVVVYANQKENPSPAKPYLYIHLNPLELPGQLQAVAVQVHVRQTLQSLVSDSRIVNAMTWDVHTVVAMRPSEVSVLKETVVEMVDRFVADWRAVH